MKRRLPGHTSLFVASMCAVALVLGGAGLAFGFATSHSSVRAFFSRADGSLPLTTPQDNGAVDPALYQRFGVLRQPPSQSDALPGSAATSQAVRFGADLSQARRALRTHSGDELFVVPTSGGLCLVSKLGRGEECVPAGLVVQGQAATSVVCAPGLPPGTVEVAGLLPDGASAVSARLTDGKTTAVELGQNVYVLDRPTNQPLPESITWRDAAGAHETATSMPADAASTRCADPNVRPELGGGG